MSYIGNRLPTAGLFPLSKLPMNLQDGLQALQTHKYDQAIAVLTAYCQTGVDPGSPYYVQAQIALARAYKGNNEREKAMALCEQLKDYPQQDVQKWATGFISILNSQENSGFFSGNLASSPPKFHKAGRIGQTGIKLPQPARVDDLSFVSLFTIICLFLLLGGILWGFVGLAVIKSLSTFLFVGFAILIGVILAQGWAIGVMDWLLSCFYPIHWQNLNEIREQSEEAVEVILRICREKSIKFPRLGRIDQSIPLAFSYGSLWSPGRIIVSQGVINYLDAEEIAIVYAHEMKHLQDWERGIMTLITLPIVLLNGVAAQLYRPWPLPDSINRVFQGIAQRLSYIAHFIVYPVIYLSRTREYYADHFASEITGNPNALMRALVKMTYGLVQEQGISAPPNFLEEAIRPLNIYDPQTGTATGSAYRLTVLSQRIGQIFLWDLYNPWRIWVELHSTHPIMGKRLYRLTQYTEALELEAEFALSSVIKEEKKLNRRKLYLNFVLDLLALTLPLIGIFISFVFHHFYDKIGLFQGAFWGWGMGIILKTLLVYPFSTKNIITSDIFHLMSDPYRSPVRGFPITLTGKLLGYIDQQTTLPSVLKLQDSLGMLSPRYCSKIGKFGNWWFGLTPLKSFVNLPVRATGWFYRGVIPSLHLSQLDTPQHHLTSYHRLSAFIVAGIALILGLFCSFLQG